MRSHKSIRSIQFAGLALLALANTSWLSRSRFFREPVVTTKLAITAAPAPTDRATPTASSTADRDAQTPPSDHAEGTVCKICKEMSLAQNQTAELKTDLQAITQKNPPTDKPATETVADRKSTDRPSPDHKDESARKLTLRGPSQDECEKDMDACVEKVLAFAKGECKPFLKKDSSSSSRRSSSKKDKSEESRELAKDCRDEMNDSIDAVVKALAVAIVDDISNAVGGNIGSFASEIRAAIDEFAAGTVSKATFNENIRQIIASAKDAMGDAKDTMADSSVFKAVIRLSEKLESLLGEDNTYSRKLKLAANKEMDKGIAKFMKKETQEAKREIALQKDPKVRDVVAKAMAATEKLGAEYAKTMADELNENGTDHGFTSGNSGNVAAQILALHNQNADSNLNPNPQNAPTQNFADSRTSGNSRNGNQNLFGQNQQTTTSPAGTQNQNQNRTSVLPWRQQNLQTSTTSTTSLPSGFQRTGPNTSNGSDTDSVDANGRGRYDQYDPFGLI